jgi:tetrapyrrole methylase family protein/MazG family protein
LVRTPEQALAQWEAIKQAEATGTQRSALDGLPRRLPALLRAQRVQERAARVGFDWQDPLEATDKVREEASEVDAALRRDAAEDVAAEIGDLLFAAVNVARLACVDPERALQGAVDRFRLRFQRMQEAAGAHGRELGALTVAELEQLWVEAKERESRR